MNRKKVTLCELNYLPNMLPLVSGYLKAYAQKDAELKRLCDFTIYAQTVKTPSSELIKCLIDQKRDVYGFSCYIWNMGLIKRILPALIENVPRAKIILGGPQVQGRIADYVSREHENVFIANGEGELIFSEFLREVVSEKNEFGKRPGLNFWKHGEVVTTENPPHLADLDEIPSPFLEGIFDDIPFTTASFETNRGCPYTCAFCYFSKGHGERKIRRFSRARIEKEIRWLNARRMMYLFIADANWGLFPQDIEISRVISNLAKKSGSPMFIYFSSAKNRPDDVLEISKAFKESGISNCQPVSFQSLNPTVLELISRINIKPEKIEELQRKFEEHQINSYIEIIWPLPGETLATFQDGIGDLCEKEIGTITCYPLLLLPNTALWTRQEEFGFVSTEADDDVSETRIATQTKWVTEEEFEEGVRFYFATHALYNLATLRHVARYLHKNKGIHRSELFRAFTRYWRENREHPFASWVEDEAIKKREFFDNGSIGICAHLILYKHRDEFTAYLHRFVTQQVWWRDSRVQLFYELDLLNTPYLYSNEINLDPVRFQQRFQNFTILEAGRNKRMVSIPPEQKELIDREIIHQISIGAAPNGNGHYEISYVTKQLPFMKSWGKEQIGSYGQGAVQSSRTLLPQWKQLQHS